MKVLFATSEGAPFIKTGGLGDVAFALPESLAAQGVETTVVMPLYKSIRDNYNDQLEFITNFNVPLSWRNLYCGIYTTRVNNVVYFFIDNEYYFRRDRIYGEYDDGERYAFFSKAILEMLHYLDYFPDVIHANDWQTALIPIFKKAHYSSMCQYNSIRVVFSIHNIEYQGKMPISFFANCLGLPDYFMQYLSYGGCLNFMHSAIVLADKICTVSRTYAEEIKDKYFAHGLEQVLQQHWFKLSGIVNGIDTEQFSPKNDKLIAKNYTAARLTGKVACKEDLQCSLGLEQNTEIPIIGMITRLVKHKGLDLVECVAEDIIRDAQLVILGTGDEPYERFVSNFAARHPGRVSTNIKFDGGLASKIYAGCDMFLMPSNSEPCGLAQMISMSYGTIPIVREVGGLKDTVYPVNPENLEGRGFTFKSYNAHDMLNAIQRAIDLYRNKDAWKTLMKKDMKEDFSWTVPASEYIKLYSE